VTIREARKTTGLGDRPETRVGNEREQYEAPWDRKGLGRWGEAAWNGKKSQAEDKNLKTGGAEQIPAAK